MSDGAYIPPHRRRKQAASHSHEQEFQGRDPTTVFTRVCCINLRRRPDRWKEFLSRLEASLGENGKDFIQKVERFDASDGAALLESSLAGTWSEDVVLDWDASKNAIYDRHIEPPMQKCLTPGELGCAMSHIRLWKELADDSADATMLVLEDDVVFYKGRSTSSQQSRPWKDHSRRTRQQDRGFNRSEKKAGFFEALSGLLERVPDDWQMLYLGFSDRGERKIVTPGDNKRSEAPSRPVTPEVIVFKPTYGFHTHAYALKQSAARLLLSHLPVTGPIDVWLADNEWFGLTVYCGLVANEGWRRTGASLISQDRRRGWSDIDQSGREGEAWEA